jgi:hypothetical protein
MTDWARALASTVRATGSSSSWGRVLTEPPESRVFDRVDDVGATIAETLAVQLPAAELFYVSADMTSPARHAADALTGYWLHPEDLPAQVGLMVYEHPPG